MSRTAVLLNDTSNESHLGCLLVTKNICSVCKKYDTQIIASFTRKQLQEGCNLLAFIKRKKVDLVIVNGEGTLHHSPKCTNVLLDNVRGTPKILVNCVWEKMYCCKEILDQFSHIMVRESKSYREIRNFVSEDKVEIVPDLIFYDLDRLKLRKIGYSDSVMPHVRSILCTNKNYFPVQTEATSPDVYSYLSWLRNLDLLVTGRFHSVCLAMMLGVPFLAIPSNSCKIEGILEDCGCSDLIIHDLSDVERKKDLATASVKKIADYVNSAKDKILISFGKILNKNRELKNG